MHRILWKVFVEHPSSTDNPQSYWSHGKSSIVNSLGLICYGFLGVAHGLFPCLFKFSTSSKVIRSFILVVKSNRHKPEIKNYISKEIVDKIVIGGSALTHWQVNLYEQDELDTSTWD